MIYARTKSPEDTQSFAAALSQAMQPRDLVLLVGEMGAGKTTFTQGFGRALGIEEPITSPTFVLLRSYQARLPLHHVDLYRIEQLQEVIDLGVLELLDEGGVALVEWGDLATPVLPRDYLEIHLEAVEDEQSRRFRLDGVGSAWALREHTLVDLLSPWIVLGEEEAR